MSTQQPEALRLAEITEFDKYPRHPDHNQHTAAELRRLHSVNAELLEALKQAEPMLQSILDNITRALPQYKKMPALDQVRAAIAKATGVA
jgi:hypothetical protein